MIFYLTTLVITAFMEHEECEQFFSNGRMHSRILMISLPTRFLSVYFRKCKCVQAFVGCSLPKVWEAPIDVELKKALNEELIPLDVIDSNLWNQLSIPNASESKNQFFLDSIPSPICQTCSGCSNKQISLPFCAVNSVVHFKWTKISVSALIDLLIYNLWCCFYCRKCLTKMYVLKHRTEHWNALLVWDCLWGFFLLIHASALCIISMLRVTIASQLLCDETFLSPSNVSTWIQKPE